MKLDGRVSIVTGGNSGIGRATALLFAREGSKVVVAGRNSTRGKEVVKAIEEARGEAIFVETDVSKSADVKALVKKTIGRFGRIDVLFNNAALSPVGTILDTSEKEWSEVIGTNLTGTFLCTKYVLPHMIERKSGVIINTGSINSVMAMKKEAAYDASKGGVLLLTRAVALDFAEFNIRANCICPGAIDTPMLKAILAQTPDPAAAEVELAKKHALGRIGSPDEVAKMALFLASDDSSFVTGAIMPVDGGMLGGWT
ncbi:MAG: SDR family oxidoreductase [Nitrososphaerales archaeon]|jgi:NAD(P)-dependent dehydrogenase (short-subunit alcohol dehydrogenase family)